MPGQESVSPSAGSPGEIPQLARPQRTDMAEGSTTSQSTCTSAYAKEYVLVCSCASFSSSAPDDCLRHCRKIRAWSVSRVSPAQEKRQQDTAREISSTQRSASGAGCGPPCMVHKALRSKQVGMLYFSAEGSDSRIKRKRTGDVTAWRLIEMATAALTKRHPP